jgi:hypothetical protein
MEIGEMQQEYEMIEGFGASDRPVSIGSRPGKAWAPALKKFRR